MKKLESKDADKMEALGTSNGFIPGSHGNEDIATPLSPTTTTTADVTIADTVQLKKTFGLFNGVGLIVGTIIGSGIFVSPKGVLIESGSVGVALLVWTFCGIICLLGALCFAELGTCIRKSGGMYAYINEAFGPMAAFLYLWVFLIVIGPAANAVISLTFAYYIIYPAFPDCKSPQAAVQILAVMAVCKFPWLR